jgi:glycosyltransferase involved in cell wall biosynthesis
VLTGYPNYPTGRVAAGYRVKARQDERQGGIDVRRVALYPNHDTSPVRRVANYASFGASATAFGLDALRGVDALWVNYSPITVAWPMWAARLVLRVPAVVHVLDLWPDTLLASGFARGGATYQAASKALHAWCAGMYRAAHSIAYISPGAGSVLAARGVNPAKLHYVPMWADEQLFRPSKDDVRSELGLGDDAIVLLYAGALGEAQGLDSLIDACAQVDDPRFIALIAGSGVAETRLRDRARDLALHNVRFLGRYPHKNMTGLMAAADLSYVALRAHALSPVTMPSKAQAAMAAARAMLIAAEGDVAAVGAESGAALLARPEDPRSIATSINEACTLGRTGLAELGRRAREYYQRTFSIDRGVSAIEGLLVAAARREAA